MNHAHLIERSAASELHRHKFVSLLLACLSFAPIALNAQALRIRSTTGNSTEFELADVSRVTFTEDLMTTSFWSGTPTSFMIVDIAGMDYTDLVTSATEHASAEPLAFQVQPNPVTDRMALNCMFDTPGDVVWEIRDARGEMVYRSTTQKHTAGPWTSTWDRTDPKGQRVSPGIYFCRLIATGVEVTRPFIVVN